MPNFKHIIEVSEDEKRYHQLLHELSKNGEYIIDNASTLEWNGTLRKFGIQAKPLIKYEFLEPIWQSRNIKYSDKRLVRLAKNVIVEETQGNGKSFYHFKKINSTEENPKS